MDDQQRAALKSRLADVHASFEQAEQSIVLRDSDFSEPGTAASCRVRRLLRSAAGVRGRATP